MSVAICVLILIPLLLLLLAVMIFRACRGQWWPLGVLIGLPLFLWFLTAKYEHQQADQIGAEARAEAVKVQAIANERVKAKLTNAESPSSATTPALTISRPERPTAELWEELTKSRIDLDGEAEKSPVVRQAAKAAEQAEEDSEELIALDPPDWVTNKPKPVGNVYRVVVQSDPFYSEDECFDQLEEKFEEEVRERLTKILPATQKADIRGASLAELGIPLSFVMKEICRESHTTLVDSSVGTMKTVHVLMEFDGSVEQELRSDWIAYQRRQGRGMVSRIAAMVLSGLAICYSLLQVDTWTRGYYTKRLLVGLPVAIIAVALLVFA